MKPFPLVSGSVIETNRYINVPLRMWERYPARERREVWLREANGHESKWVIHTRVLPARRGHRVVLLIRKEWVVGLHNNSTGEGVNYVRVDPPFLLRGVDLLVIAATAILLPWYLGAAGFVLLVPAGAGYLMAAIVVRVLHRWWLQFLVAAAMRELREVSNAGPRVV
ncbi:MAG TPA: hypothetical protein VMG60_15460 [Burkholderiaceae bacterium]|nr:hypothetical protein [Burkholderiaceae bacterium]